MIMKITTKATTTSDTLCENIWNIPITGELSWRLEIPIRVMGPGSPVS